MHLIQRLDDYGKPAWITLMVVSFILFWPVGLAVLFFLIWSGRMGHHCGRRGRWYYAETVAGGDESHGHGRRGWRRHWRREREPERVSTGNSAFDEYREATLKRLQDEQAEFEGFLEQLRHAKDKAEFDQFMADRRSRPAAPEASGDDIPPPQA